MKITGYYGEKSETPFRFIPMGICLKVPLHKQEGFIIDQEIDIDDCNTSIYLNYSKKRVGCGTIVGERFQ